MSVDTLLSLLEKLLQTRSANKSYVCDNCLLPLKTAVKSLHEDYQNRFVSYRQELEKNGASKELSQRVKDDVRRILPERMDIVFQLERLESVGDSRIDGGKSHLKSLTRRLSEYLYPRQLIDDFCRQQLASLPNPNYQVLNLHLETEDPTLTIAIIERILDSLTANYGRWQMASHKFEEFLRR